MNLAAITPGVLVILSCVVIYYFSLRSSKIEKFNLSLGLIILAGFILRIFTSLDGQLHLWDEQFHALVAKNLITNPLKPMLYAEPLLEFDYRLWNSNHVWLHKQPFPLYSMALSLLIFGKTAFAVRIPSIVLSTIAIWSTFKIAKILFNNRIAILAAFLVSINGLIIEQTAGRVATDHIDVFFFSFTSFSIYFLLKHAKSHQISSLIYGAVFCGLAILSKWLPALIVFPVWLIAVYNKRSLTEIVKFSSLFFLIVIVMVLPWQIYININFPEEAAWEYAYNRKHVFESLTAQVEPFYFHFDKMRIIFGELVYIPLMWLIYSLFRKKNIRNELIIACWIIIPYLFFSLVKTKMQGYILISASAIEIMIALFIYKLRDFKFHPYLKTAVIFLLIALPVRYSLERIKPFELNYSVSSRINTLIDMENESSTNQVIFNVQDPIQVMFFTDIIAYENIPDISELRRIKSQGYNIIIEENSNLSDDYYQEDYLKIINLK